MKFKTYLLSLGLTGGELGVFSSGRYCFKAGSITVFCKAGLKPTVDTILDMYVNRGKYDAMWLTDKSGMTVIGEVKVS